jgi:hypothetical protein
VTVYHKALAGQFRPEKALACHSLGQGSLWQAIVDQSTYANINLKTARQAWKSLAKRVFWFIHI